MNPSDQQQLHAAAEAALAQRPAGLAPGEADGQSLLYDLQVHQIELEMQNEALREAQSALAVSRDRYVELYEFAPVGYLTLARDGSVKEINLTAVTLLGIDGEKLLQREFVSLVAAEDQPRWAQIFRRLKEDASQTRVELTMRRGDGTLLPAQLDCAVEKLSPGGSDADADAAGRTEILVVLQDISERKLAEIALRQQHDELVRFNRVAIDRELAMIGLKQQVNALSQQLGQAAPFKLDFVNPPTPGVIAAAKTPADGAPP